MIKRMILAALAACMLATAAWAAAPLDGPLTIVVGYPPGGSSDRIARLVAERLKDRVGVSVIVENKTGAGGRISAQLARNADASQNVLLLGNPAVMVVAPLVYANPGYDARRDFKPVSLVSSYRFALAVSADSPMKDMQALRAWLKENPDRFVVGVPATGSLPHFFALMLGGEIGRQAEVVGYRGSAPLISELVGGILPQAIDTLIPCCRSIRAGVCVSWPRRAPSARRAWRMCRLSARPASTWPRMAGMHSSRRLPCRRTRSSAWRAISPR